METIGTYHDPGNNSAPVKNRCGMYVFFGLFSQKTHSEKVLQVADSVGSYTDFSTVSFTGKETDCETGFSYFGARYYDPTLLTSFLSIDRYADKYPSLSPYHYCAWNPIKLIDPNGDSLRIMGNQEQREAVIGALNQRYKNLRFECDDNGYVTLNYNDGLTTLETQNDLYIQTMINDKNIVSTLNVSNDRSLVHNGVKMLMQENSNSMFGGNIIEGGKVICSQYINITGCQTISLSTGRCKSETNDHRLENNLLGKMIMHEFSEGYEGGMEALRTGKSMDITDDNYIKAHSRANNHFNGEYFQYYDINGRRRENVWTNYMLYLR